MPDFEIVTLKSGAKSIRSLKDREIFHPGTGPLFESTILYVKQQRLVERYLNFKNDRFIIWDVGLGGGSNAVAAIEALRSFQQPQVEIYSFDRIMSPLQFALDHASELGYLANYSRELHQLILTGESTPAPNIRWQLVLGDFKEALSTRRLPSPHAIFYDPYSPSANPEMWTLDLFQLLWNSLDPQTPCLLTNYTRSTAVRATLLLAGFFVGQGCEIGNKSETTVASNRFELLECPLDQRWLKRAQFSTHSAPLRFAGQKETKISQSDFERIRLAPQFLIERSI